MENTKTTFRPILFSTPMVQAILEGRKTMTRRTKGLEGLNASGFEWRFDGLSEEGDYAMEMLENGSPKEIYKQVVPAYNVGNVLWVRETFFDCSKYKNAPLFQNTIGDYIYKSDTDFIGCHKWKPSIFMPKSACRIFLKVKAIRAERLQDISEEDAIAEGVEKIADYGTTGYRLYTEPEASYADIDAVYSFESLWESINGKDSLDSNPFVFVYEFERIDKPKDFI